jgi:hypothetical protein
MTLVVLAWVLSGAAWNARPVIVIASHADAAYGCPIHDAVLGALERRLPGLGVRRDGVAEESDFRLAIGSDGGGTWRLTLSLADGRLVLSRELPRNSWDCRDAAELGALIIERYFVELAWPGMKGATPWIAGPRAPAVSPPQVPSALAATPRARTTVAAAAGACTGTGPRLAPCFELAVARNLIWRARLEARVHFDMPRKVGVADDSGRAVGELAIYSGSALLGVALAPVSAVSVGVLGGVYAVRASAAGAAVVRPRAPIAFAPLLAVALEPHVMLGDSWLAMARVAAGYSMIQSVFTVRGIQAPAYVTRTLEARVMLGIARELP